MSIPWRHNHVKVSDGCRRNHMQGPSQLSTALYSQLILRIYAATNGLSEGAQADFGSYAPAFRVWVLVLKDFFDSSSFKICYVLWRHWYHKMSLTFSLLRKLIAIWSGNYIRSYIDPETLFCKTCLFSVKEYGNFVYILSTYISGGIRGSFQALWSVHKPS